MSNGTQAGTLLRAEAFEFDLCYTSVLKRCVKSLQFILEELDQLWLPVEKSWRLNEKHYGDLQDRNKAETAEKYGDRQVQIWRRSYDIAPARELAELAIHACKWLCSSITIPLQIMQCHLLF